MTSQEQELRAIAVLNHWGVPFLSSPHVPELQEGDSTTTRTSLIDLLTCLIQSDAARLKLGVTAFFLVHPEEASVVLQVLPSLKEGFGQLLKYYYTASVYLQALWRSQLAGFGKALPDYFSQDLGLPEPKILHGRLGLVSLEEALQKQIHQPYNYQASFESLVRLLRQSVRPS